MFHWTTICRGENHPGKNFVPPIKTRSPVMKAVKLMAWRKAKSLVNIPVCQLLGSLYRWHKLFASIVVSSTNGCPMEHPNVYKTFLLFQCLPILIFRSSLVSLDSSHWPSIPQLWSESEILSPRPSMSMRHVNSYTCQKEMWIINVTRALRIYSMYQEKESKSS